VNEIGPVRGKDFVKRLVIAEILMRRGEEGPLARPRVPRPIPITKPRP
jgi:hypothetical protein